MNMKYSVVALFIGIALMFVSLPIGGGFIVGVIALSVLKFLRKKFYTVILEQETFNVRQYIGYVIMTMILIIGPLGLSFFIQDIISPYSVFAVFFLDRIYLYLSNLFKKEGESHVSS